MGVDEPLEDRLDRVSGLVRAEADLGADAVMLPEMWVRGWFDFDAYAELAEPLDGPLVSALSDLARAAGVLLVAGSIVERAGSEDIHNTALAFDPDGELVSVYRKVHLFSFGDARESDVLRPGGEPATFDWEGAGARVGLSICYDLRFPELYRRQVDDGAELLLVVSAWPEPRVEAWRTLVRARAIESQAAIVACNAAGEQGGHTYAGRSAAYDAWGEPLGELGPEPGMLRVELDVEDVRAQRASFPPLRDRVL